ncbi:MAG: M61 family peptidase, partial [Cyclobacteriaceae bacterium]
TQYLKITVEIPEAGNRMLLQLPFWRPGRYEAANYAKNIRQFKVTDSAGNPLICKKTDNSTWQLELGQNQADIRVSYQFYAAELTAGSTLIDEEIVYINFINCLIYNPEKIDEACKVHINLPDSYTAATSLTSPETNVWEASDYYQLADSPILAAPNLTHFTYDAEKIPFHIWIYGEVTVDRDKLISHFKRFSEEQINTMGDFPEKDYHFLIITAPYKLYHGVEHASSTVICLGPAKDLADELYDQLLGISSHELFHAWNILKIRPAQLLPYRFNKIPVFDTGFVAEGFTTYLGDLFLVRSGVRSVEWYLSELTNLLKRHYENFGRLNTSVAESSIDLWLDGYQAGAPHRKSSIYVEGAVIALMLDLKIRKTTGQEESIFSLMKILYQDYANQDKGYTATDIQQIAEQLSGTDLNEFFDSYVYGTKDTRPLIDNLFVHYGLHFSEKENENAMEGTFGVRVLPQEGKWKVLKTAPGSEGELKLRPGDQILAVNGNIPGDTIEDAAIGAEVEIRRLRNGMEKEIKLKKSGTRYFPVYEIRISDQDNDALHKWLIHESR